MASIQLIYYLWGTSSPSELVSGGLEGCICFPRKGRPETAWINSSPRTSPFLAWHFKDNRAKSNFYTLGQTVFFWDDHGKLSHPTCFSTTWSRHSSMECTPYAPPLSLGGAMICLFKKTSWKWRYMASKGLSYEAMQLLPCQLGHLLLEPWPPSER